MKRAMCWWMAAALAASSEACVSASAVTNPQLLGSWQRAAQNSGGDQLVRDQVVTFGDDTSFRNHELSQRAPTAATQPGCVVDSDFQGSYVVNGDALAITYERATIARSNCANAQDNGQSAASDADITRYNDGEFGTGRSFSVRGDELTLSSPRGDTVYRRVRPPTANAAQVTSVAGAAGAQPAGGSAAEAPQQKPVRR